ncbi:MAG: alcohol dehydrogenase [Bacteroidetes bacterium]|jgi:outer membrane protein assembly factor BamB|nr:alcohol dehydrogenase [Bacteroidota bacterium]|tara:strand:- start:225 stop:1481 length:1257 start_codon:yes stop_codon:yes gene_type:complete
MKSSFLVIILLIVIVEQNYCQILSQWRGENRNGIYNEENLLISWPENGPDSLWAINGIGKGYSSASVTEDAIYVTGLFDPVEVVTALDLNGNKLWQTEFGSAWNASFNPSRCTPTVVNGKVYVISGLGHIACLDSKTGDILWNFDAYKKFEGEWDIWGTSESLLYHDGKVFYTPCGDKTTMVALDANTGETIWKSISLPDSSAYTSPILISYKEQEMIVAVTSNYIFTVNPQNGDIIWKKTYSEIDPPIEHPDNPLQNTNSPLYHDGQIYVTSGYNHVGVMFKLNEDGTDANLIWKDSTLDVHHGGVVLVDGYIYGANFVHRRDGNWCCIDWETGKTMYEKKWKCKGSIISADNKLYCYEEKRGNIALVEPTVNDFEIISSFRPTIKNWPHWSHLVIRNGVLYVRHADVLMAFNVRNE